MRTAVDAHVVITAAAAEPATARSDQSAVAEEVVAEEVAAEQVVTEQVAAKEMATDEVIAAFLRYEKALVAGDLEVLAESFWDDDATIRFGVADHQVGAAALRRWRAEQPPLGAGRELFDTRVTTFDGQSASVTTCFRYPGRTMIGRQSQMWVRFPGGWRIVSAHVSEIPAWT